jgi:hypothetical protein
VRAAAGDWRYVGTLTTAEAGVEVVFEAALVVASVESEGLVVPNAGRVGSKLAWSTPL